MVKSHLRSHLKTRPEAQHCPPGSLPSRPLAGPRLLVLGTAWNEVVGTLLGAPWEGLGTVRKSQGPHPGSVEVMPGLGQAPHDARGP